VKPLNEYYRNRLPFDFYRNNNVCTVAKQLIGKILVTYFEHTLTTGRIVETEAYNGVIDKASHAYGGRFTNRTAVMYEPGGIAYVYLCYGIHHLFNVVTNKTSKSNILATPRIGVDYAEEDALLPYRFIVKEHLQVTKHVYNKTV